MTSSRTHLVLIPSYNTGPKVYETVLAARAQWSPVWVVVDGSTDGTTDGLRQMAAADPGLTLLVLPANCGKGASVLHGSAAAIRRRPSVVPSVLPSTTTHTGHHCARAARTVSYTLGPVL